jgi:hypothetical protein
MGPLFTARFTGKCWWCSGFILPGDKVRFIAPRTLVHRGCTPPRMSPKPKRRLEADSSTSNTPPSIVLDPILGPIATQGGSGKERRVDDHSPLHHPQPTPELRCRHLALQVIVGCCATTAGSSWRPTTRSPDYRSTRKDAVTARKKRHGPPEGPE